MTDEVRDAQIEAYQAALAIAAPVVEAARALVEHSEAPGPKFIERERALFDVLAARVRAHTDTTTEKG